MLSQAVLEYRCPRCGFINALSRDARVDNFKERLESCHHCKQKLEVIVANGINDNINLIVSAQEDVTQ